jgi:hypothetical protein
VHYLIYISQGQRLLCAVTRKRKDMAKDAAQKLATRYAAYQNRLIPDSVTDHKALLGQIEEWAKAPAETSVQLGLLTLHLGFTSPPDLKTGVHGGKSNA